MDKELEKLFKETQNSVRLSDSMGTLEINEMLQGIVGIYERLFPNRIRSYYVIGSQAEGVAVAMSDIDVLLVFREKFESDAERHLAHQIGWLCDMISPILLDITPSTDSPDDIYNSAFLQWHLRPIYGEDIRPSITLPAIDDYIRFMMNATMQKWIRHRRNLVFPLDYPDPDGEFFGYDLEGIYSIPVCQNLGTKGLIWTLCPMVTAIVTLKTGRFVAGKSEGFRFYQKYVNDEWADFLAEVWDTCRVQWESRMPTDSVDRKKVRAFSQKILAFENHYLTLYKQFWLRDLEAAQGEYVNVYGDRKLQAIRHLGDVVYPDDTVENALKPFENSDNPDWRKETQDTLQKIRKMKNQ